MQERGQSVSRPAFFPECVAKGSRLTWESELCLRDVVFEFATVRNCSNPAPMALPLGGLSKVTFHGCVTCEFVLLLHCDLSNSQKVVTRILDKR